MRVEKISELKNHERISPEIAAAELIEQRVPLKKLMPLFEDRRQCAAYFARSYAELNTARAAAGSCCVCAAAPAAALVNYGWQARFSDGVGFGGLEAFLLLLGHVGIKMKYSRVSFETFHPICGSCKKTLRRRRGIANVLNFVGLMSVIVAMLPAALGWAGALYFQKAEDRTFFIELGLLSTGVLVFGILCMMSLNVLRVPLPLRYLAKRPFTRHSIAYLPPVVAPI